MKQRSSFILSLATCALFARTPLMLSAARDDGQYDQTINTMVWQKSPGRWVNAINPDVVHPLVKEWIAKNPPATHGQELIATRWNMTLSAYNGDWAAFEKDYAKLRAETNAAARAGQLDAFIRRAGGLHQNTHVKFRTNARTAIDKVFAGSEKDFSAARQMEIHQLLAGKGIGIYRDRTKAEWDRHFNAVKAMKDVPPHRARALAGMINSLFALGREVAREAFEANRALLGEEQESAYLLAYAGACTGANDRENFDRTVATIKVFKSERKAKPYAAILGQMSGFDMKTARELLEEALADKSLSEGDRVRYLETRMSFYAPQVFCYGQNEPGRYQMWKKTVLERADIIAKSKLKWSALDYNGYAGTAMAFEDYAWAWEMVEKGLKASPSSPSLLTKRARLRMMEKGDRAGAADDFEAASKAKGGFDRDTDAKLFADVAAYLRTKATPKDDLKAMRRLSRQLYALRLYDECRALQAQWTKDLLVPFVPKVHKVTFDPDAPRSAEGFVHSKYYNDWAGMETRFEKFGADYHMSAARDAQMLKAKPNLTPDPKYRTGIRVIADNDGVHIFMRCDDPAIDEVKTGKRKDAGSLELFFEPGDHEVPYHSVFFEGLPGMGDSADAVWAMPGRHFRRTTDIITKDTVLTKEGVVAHLSIPWIGCYDTLPFEGRHWLFGMFRWHPGGGQCIGGNVHALTRGLRLEFPFPPATIAALKARIAETAYNRYARVRNAAGDFIQQWNDALLGDPAFFAAEVKPLLEELDAKGKTPAIGDAAGWAEVGYEIGERRTRYLKRQFFKGAAK